MSAKNDTHPDVERKMIELLRAAGPDRRVAMACAMTNSVCAMSRAAIARVHPHLEPRARDLLFVRVTYGRALADRLRRHLAAREAA